MLDMFVVGTATPVETLLTAASTSITSSVNGALVPAATIFALIAGIFVGFKIFKKLTGARS